MRMSFNGAEKAYEQGRFKSLVNGARIVICFTCVDAVGDEVIGGHGVDSASDDDPGGQAVQVWLHVALMYWTPIWRPTFLSMSRHPEGDSLNHIGLQVNRKMLEREKYVDWLTIWEAIRHRLDIAKRVQPTMHVIVGEESHKSHSSQDTLPDGRKGTVV